MRRLPLPHHKHDPSSRRGLVKGAERMDSRQDLPSPSSASKSASDRAPAPRESHCLIVPETSGQPASEPPPDSAARAFCARSSSASGHSESRHSGWLLGRGKSEHLTGSQTIERLGGTEVIDSVGDTVVPLSTKSGNSQPTHPAGEGGWRPVSREFQSHGMGNRIECGSWDHWVEGAIRVSNGFGVNS
jgi:hypothetical protein